jgi:transposase
MAMSKRSGGEKQEDIWIAHTELAVAPGHPFYKRLNELLEGAGFDELVEGLCARFYHARLGRPSLRPGVYFRALLVGYFEGIDSERGIAWRVADSLALRRFLRIGLDERTPDHSTISRTRRLIDIDTHGEVFSWVLGLLAERGLLKGQRMGIDATTLEANAAMRSIVRRDTGETYEEFLRGLAKASGIETPTREDLARLDRKRKKRTSNKEWKSPVDEDARIAKMKDGRTHLAHKAEHAVDMDTGAIVAVTLQAADQGDTTTLDETLCQAGEQVAEQIGRETELRPKKEPKINLNGIEELVTDKGYHSGAVVQRVKSYAVRSYIPEKQQKGRRDWQGKRAEQQAVYENRRRVRGAYGKSLLRRRGELIERSFAHCYETGAGEHSETAVDTRGSVQPESDSAKAAGSGHAAGAEKSCGPGGFATLALSAVPNDPRFACPATYCRCWSAPRIIFPLPHVSSPLAEYQQFCHGLLGTNFGALIGV